MWETAELERSFADYNLAWDQGVSSGDWTVLTALMVEDFHYYDHGDGLLIGRQRVEEWAGQMFERFPWSITTHFTVPWQIIDPEAGRVACKVLNVFADPGDGSVHGTPNLNVVDYAGGGLWRAAEDAYNPAEMLEHVEAWAAVAQVHGRLPADAEPWLAQFRSA